MSQTTPIIHHPAETLATLRRALGLSVNDMADALGLLGDNAADNLRQMERGARNVPGTVQVLLRYMQQAIEIDDAGTADALASALPRWLDCTDLEDDTGAVEIIMHTRWPRFYALCLDDLPDAERDMLEAADIAVLDFPPGLGLGMMVPVFIDRPTGDPAPLLAQALRLKAQQAGEDLGL